MTTTVDYKQMFVTKAEARTPERNRELLDELRTELQALNQMPNTMDCLRKIQRKVTMMAAIEEVLQVRVDAQAQHIAQENAQLAEQHSVDCAPALDQDLDPEVQLWSGINARIEDIQSKIRQHADDTQLVDTLYDQLMDVTKDALHDISSRHLDYCSDTPVIADWNIDQVHGMCLSCGTLVDIYNISLYQCGSNPGYGKCSDCCHVPCAGDC